MSEKHLETAKMMEEGGKQIAEGSEKKFTGSDTEKKDNKGIDAIAHEQQVIHADKPKRPLPVSPNTLLEPGPAKRSSEAAKRDESHEGKSGKHSE